MKTKRFLQGFATFAIIVLFAGCTNILDSKTAEKSKENTSVSINFNANGRYISAGSFELNRITSWKVIFKSDSGEKDIELAWSSETSDTSSNSSSPSLNYSEGVLNAKLIPTGIYDITLEGSYSEGNGTVTVSGTKEDVTVSAETAKNYITVLVGLKKDSFVNGSLELSFNTTDISKYASALHVTLKNIQTGDIEYSTDSTDKKTLVFSASDNGYTLTGTDIAPGWYKLEFYHSDSVKIEIPGDKMMVEIASGIKTTDSDIKLSGTSVKKYYATNDNSESYQKMNGLSVSSRKNLTALLETLTKNWPGVPEVEIFMDKVPEIDIKTFNELKKTLGDSKRLSIYLGESTSPIIAADSNSDTNTVNTELWGSACLVATDGNEKFEITNLSVGQDQVNSIDITLKNGACLDFTGEMPFSGKLNIYAIKDSEDGTVQDNFASYIATPFFSSFSNTGVNSFSLREYASKKVSEHNTIISVPKESEGVSCEFFYIKPASMKGITAESSDKLYIEANYSSDIDKNVYVSGSAIPYESSSLEIKLNNPEGIEIKNCLWYLNGESFGDSGSELTGFDPTQASSLNVDGKNVISCFASVGEKLYLCEFNFTFKPSRSAAVWFSGEGNNYSMKQIYDYTDSAATESIIKGNLTSDSKYYCFDKNYNLWTVTYENALALNKYSMKVSTGSYSTTPDFTKQLSEITSLSDMYYDCVNSYIYLLVNGDSAVNVYAVSTGSEPAIVASASIDMSNLKTTTFTNIAVNGNDFYFADSSCNVYKATGTVTSGTIGTPTLVKELATSAILEGHDSSKYDDTYDSISITDLQFGDGLGYGAENVYALIKESSWGLGFTHSDYFYSRGALVKINATDGSFIDKFGWTSEQKELKYTNYGVSYTDYYYIPDGADPTAFFGPEKFCAVVPKKIVVVDDGFYWKAGDTGDGKIKNKDSIVEFDIAGSTLTRGAASISASFNIGTTDYYSRIVEN
ncbi:hypothetical protein [Treponema berlinense]|uniref:hypothetical protein n=1 Tax=Treponema berlinense TaxID=225004 RepID=UPI0023F7ED8D|nr:hypothetical protein [Treponema berlinense]